MEKGDYKTVMEFKKEAMALQQEYCDVLGDREWDVIEKDELTILQRKIGFGTFGPPNSTPTSDNKETGYNKEQLGVIEKICDQLVKDLNFSNYNIHFACIFVVIKGFSETFPVPLFKAKRESSSQCIFVDTGARKYCDWDDYLNKNTLEKCIYCYPSYGKYEQDLNNKVCVKFGKSPACEVASRVLSFIDKVATVATIAATGVGVAALCTVPIAGPIMAATAVAGATTGVYGVSRSSYALYDRATHDQSIALTDAEARGCWLNIVGSSLGFAQGRIIASITNAARAGEVMGKAGRIMFLMVQTGSLTVNGLGIVHGLAILIDKHERKQLTPLDVFQFSASLLFFTNAAVNMKTAKTIIKEVQHDVIDSHRQGLSKKAEKLFDKQTGKLRGKNEMYGNAKVVKQLNRIENSNELFEMMADKNIKNYQVRLTNKGFKGNLLVNKNLKIHPLKLLSIPPESRQAIFESTKSYSKGTLTKNQFHSEMKIYCNKHRIVFESMRNETKQKLCQIYGKENIEDIVVGGTKVFANLKPHEIDRLRVVLENTVKNNQSIIEMATEFARTRNCDNVKDFIAYTEYIVADLNKTVKSYEVSYQKDLAAAKKEFGFNQEQFDRSRGIEQGMGSVEFHKQKALNQFNNPEGYDRLNKRFDTLKSEVSPLNQKCQPGFFTDNEATYHYLKHKYFGSAGQLTPEEYFNIAQDVVQNPLNRTDSILSQDGSCVMITFKDSQNGVKVIKIDRTDGGSGIATVMYDNKVFSKRS